jgi:hypothetical protein
LLALVLSLASAASWGVSDFLGGVQSRRLPVLAVLAVLSVKVDPAPRAAILEICAGGALLSLLSGLRLRAARPNRVLHALLALAALGCLAYVAVYRGDLIGMVQETFRAGRE